jgi:hypothetical protein
LAGGAPWVRGSVEHMTEANAVRRIICPESRRPGSHRARGARGIEVEHAVVADLMLGSGLVPGRPAACGATGRRIIDVIARLQPSESTRQPMAVQAPVPDMPGSAADDRTGGSGALGVQPERLDLRESETGGANALDGSCPRRGVNATPSDPISSHKCRRFEPRPASALRPARQGGRRDEASCGEPVLAAREISRK